MTPDNIMDLCTSCASAIYGRQAPAPHYQRAVASLLAGTAATESGLQSRRQHGFGWGADTGAWGLWQTEAAAVEDSIAYMLRRDDVAQRCAAWLFRQDAANMDPVLGMSTHALLRTLSGWDRLACLFARLHYLRIPAPVPNTQRGRAMYYKRYYNTAAGAGSVEKYLADYDLIFN